MNKTHLIGYPVAVILSLGIGAATVSAVASDPEPKTVVKTKTVTEAPPECGTVINSLADLASAVGKGLNDMGEAFNQASADGDLEAMGATVSAAVEEIGNYMEEQTPAIKAATDACGAAVPQ